MICIVGILTSCGIQGESVVPIQDSNGKLHCSYFYQGNKISLTSPEHFLETSWNPVGFEYICQKVSCNHKSDVCPAGYIFYNDLFQDGLDKGGESIFNFEFNGKRIIVDSFSPEIEMEADEEEIQFSSTMNYKTDIYEAKLDGSDRKLVMTFDGGIASSAMSYAAILQNGKLYFSGILSMSNEVRLNKETEMLEEQKVCVEHAFFEIDLMNYKVRTFGKERCLLERGYTYQVYLYDDLIYMSRYNGNAGKADWYVVNSGTGEVQEIASFDVEAPQIIGCIEDTVISYRDNIIVSYNHSNKKTKELFLDSDEEQIIAFVIDNEIWIVTDKSYEEGNEYVEYTVMDKEGTNLRTVHYPEYITFLDVVGDRVLYLKPFTEGIEEWWCELDKIDTLEDSIYIGDYSGMDME